MAGSVQGEGATRAGGAGANVVASRTPFLMTQAGGYGALAAVRCLGRAGIPVVLGESRLLVPARWSRYVTRRMKCPGALEPEALVERLVEIGREQPGQVLYPTSDDTAWIYATWRDALGPYFRLYQPPLAAILELLDKRRLQAAAAAVGLESPETYFPADEGDVERVATSIRFPVVLKPRTQVQFVTGAKGARIDHSSHLLAAHGSFVAENRYGPALMRRTPEASLPMVQRYHVESSRRVYSVAGFVDAKGAAAMRSSYKVLQRPSHLGVGICFEEAALCPKLSAGVLDLCRQVGYWGVFEAEFIQVEGRSLLIDFNPRFYGQMAFEIGRGLPLPLLVHAAAIGDDATVSRLLAGSATRTPGAPRAFSHSMILDLVVARQWLAGKPHRERGRAWRAWRREHQPLTDPIHAWDDPGPVLAEILAQAGLFLRHPRYFFRSMMPSDLDLPVQAPEEMASARDLQP